MSRFDQFDKKCIWHVARELARSKAAAGNTPEERQKIWAEETRKSKVDATLKIAAMSNLQLLELIGKVLSDG